MKIVKLLLLSTLLVTLAALPAERINHSATLKWTRPVGNYDHFNIYRQDCSSGNFIYIKNVGGVFYWIDNAVIGGETYKYKIRTVYKGTESKDSNIVSKVIPY